MALITVTACSVSPGARQRSASFACGDRQVATVSNRSTRLIDVYSSTDGGSSRRIGNVSPGASRNFWIPAHTVLHVAYRDDSTIPEERLVGIHYSCQ